ncbi:MAG: hypothetical protein ACK49R_07260 [Planctomycetota bacterium]
MTSSRLTKLILATLALFAAACGWSPTTISAQGKPLKVFILAGQSNMEGHAEIRTFDYIGKDPLTAPSSGRCAIPMERHGSVTTSGCRI